MITDLSAKVAQIKKDLELYAKQQVNRQYILEKTVGIITDITVNFDACSDNGLSTDEQYDLLRYTQIVESILKGSTSPSDVQSDLLAWDKAILTDQIMGRMETEGIHQVHEFEAVKIDDHTKLVYLDQNIISHLLDENCTLSVTGYSFVFSPAHIEDMLSSSDQAYHTSIIQYLSKLTNDLEILYTEAGNAIIGKESPRFVYEKRVIPEINNINAAKDSKAIDYSINLLFNQNKPEKYNGTNLIEHPKEFCEKFKVEMNQALTILETGFTIDDLLSISDELANYTEINSYIHQLYHLMDVIGFKRDNISSKKINSADSYNHKYYKKIRSSRIDIEHLLYAFSCNYFFTMDERLYYRAKFIFSLLKSKCQPILIGEVDGGIEDEIKNKLP